MILRALAFLAFLLPLGGLASPVLPDRPAVLLTKIEPKYPRAMLEAGVAGQVTVEFVVNVAGMVEEAKVISSTSPEFEKPALVAVRKARFKPAIKHGQHVESRVRQPVRFELMAAKPAL